MPDAKITALTENTTPLTTDILPMVDDPAGTPLTQKITIANLVKASNFSGTLAIVNGGTGQSNVETALNALFTNVRKTGVEQGKASASTTEIVNQMAFTLLASTNYVYEFWVRYRTGATTTGLALGLDGPASPVGVWGTYIAQGSTSGLPVAGFIRGLNTTLNIPLTSLAIDLDQLAYFTGLYMNGANAGTMQLIFTTEVSGSLTSIRTGTCGRIMRIS